MSIDLQKAASFLAGYGRVLDRRRFALLATDAGPTVENRRAVLAALDGYRNADDGYGWGMEPDLRAPESQPAGALHALEAIADVGPETALATPALLDWLHRATLEDGGLPFALPVADPTACAPFWAQADTGTSSLQITAAVAAQAHRAARFDLRITGHPWLEKVTRYCFDAIAALDEAPFAYVLSFVLGFLDAAADTRPEALELLRHVGKFVPEDGAVPVAGGAEGETLHLLDYAPRPGRPVRGLLDEQAVIRDLDRLESGQLEDGGWAVDFTSYSEAAALEWRGYATVGAVSILRANGR
ncbi:hypothetical protein [Actinospica robiniae]|uniref:hypothetical protein n=1 Tax=Actinospica robiniae TaxID=304901 RepID=UPI0004172290|nr:hypothetical protein [Actinospica robiniae]